MDRPVIFMLRQVGNLYDIVELLGRSFEKRETQGFEFVPFDTCLIGSLLS
jgi:hypothetical protein